MHRQTLAPIETAQSKLSAEREEIRAEQSAFEAFAERAKCVDRPNESSAGRSPPAIRVRAPQSFEVTTTADLRRAYRKTVMAVDHYETEYGKPLQEHVAAELSSDIAVALVTDQPVTPSFVDQLLSAVEGAVEDRIALLDVLETEADSLREAHGTCADVVNAVDPTTTVTAGTTETYVERCRSVLRERQAFIQSRELSPHIDGHDLCVYLYQSVEGDWTYPVLTVAVSLLSDLGALNQRADVTAPPVETTSPDDD